MQEDIEKNARLLLDYYQQSPHSQNCAMILANSYNDIL